MKKTNKILFKEIISIYSEKELRTTLNLLLSVNNGKLLFTNGYYCILLDDDVSDIKENITINLYNNLNDFIPLLKKKDIKFSYKNDNL